jgi:hypothetical protein
LFPLQAQGRGFSAEPSPVGKVIAGIGAARTLDYKRPSV